MCSFAHLAIQYTKATGLSVCAIDIDDGKLEHAKRIGADLLLSASNSNYHSRNSPEERRWRMKISQSWPKRQPSSPPSAL
jgi:D-arabinose 1-dehydrogenase-like Zn-dependent alcohol dehydrogenase